MGKMRSRNIESGLLVVLVVSDRAAEIDRGQGREDERLQRGHQAQLEQEDQDPDRQREPPERLQPRITASPPAMNRMIMWPARMLAHSRTVSEISRMKLEITSIGKISDQHRPRDAGRIRLLRYPIGPCC